MNPSETGAWKREALTFQLNFANKRNVWGREGLRSECWRKGGVHYTQPGLGRCRMLLSLSSWVLVRLNWAELWQPRVESLKQCHGNGTSSQKALTHLPALQNHARWAGQGQAGVRNPFNSTAPTAQPTHPHFGGQSSSLTEFQYFFFFFFCPKHNLPA